MRFLDLYISGFGKFHETALTFEDGLNIVYGKNEAGKSTIHTFIRSMLFGLERQRGRAARNDTYSKYEPWENSGTYEGELRLESDGIIYRIERSFQKNRKEFTIINETTGREETDSKAVMDTILGGLSETVYNNTISISQLKSATDDGMVSELKNFIANMNTSGNMALNITKATAYLKKEKKQLEAQLSPEAARTYTSLLAEIRTLERELASPEYENQLQEYTRLRDSVRTELDQLKQKKDELAAKLTRSRQVMEEFEFTDEASIGAYLNKTEELYENYEASQAICTGRAVRFLPPIFFVLTALFAMGTVFCGYWYFRPENTLLPMLPQFLDPAASAVALSLSTAFSFCCGLFFVLRRIRHRKESQLCEATLSEILRRHLGDGTVSPQALEAFRGRMAEFVRLCQMTERSQETLNVQNNRISDLLTRQNDCSEVIEQQQRIQWELEKKLEHLADCKDRAAALKRILSENDRVRQDIAAIELAQETMKELSLSIRDSFGLYLNKTASDLIRGITGGIYSSMSIDENLNAFLNTSRKLVPLEQVSSGTADQIYLALRLAAAKFIQKSQDRLPLIFDDSFVLYDDERLKTALLWLPNAYHGQIIVFTCHKREERVLRENAAPFNLIEI